MVTEAEVWRWMAEREKTVQPYSALRFRDVPLIYVFRGNNSSRSPFHRDLVVPWCRDQFGEPGSFHDPGARWAEPAWTLGWAQEASRPVPLSVAFRDAADATAFRIRWG